MAVASRPGNALARPEPSVSFSNPADDRNQVFYEIQHAGGLDALPHPLDDITYLELEEIRKLARPPESVRRVMECVHLILNEASVPRGLPVWDDVLRTCARSDFLTKVRRYDVTELLEKPALVDYICRIYFLERDGIQPLRLERVRFGSQAVVAFFGWTVAVVAGTFQAWSVEEVGGHEARRVIEELEAERQKQARALQLKKESSMRKKIEAELAARRCEMATQTTPRQQESVQDEERQRLHDNTPNIEHQVGNLEDCQQLGSEKCDSNAKRTVGGESSDDESEPSDDDYGKNFCIWDVPGNPWNKDLEGDCNVVSFRSGAKSNFINVMTTTPFRKGTHFFEFIMHRIGGEQWCGITSEPFQAGALVSGRNLKAWSYYCGRRRIKAPSDQAGLHDNRQVIQNFAQICDGDSIGLLIDATKRVAAFLKNDQLQGTFQLPLAYKPLYLFTHLDAPGDCVEIREVPVTQAPESAIAAIESRFEAA